MLTTSARHSTTNIHFEGLARLSSAPPPTERRPKGGGNKVVHTALEVPPRYLIVGVRVCYELTDTRSHLSQVRVAQVQDPPAAASVLLDDGTDRTAVGPVCFDVAAPSIDPAKGPLLFSLRVNFGSTSDRIAIRGIGLRLSPKP